MNSPGYTALTGDRFGFFEISIIFFEYLSVMPDSLYNGNDFVYDFLFGFRANSANSRVVLSRGPLTTEGFRSRAEILRSPVAKVKWYSLPHSTKQ